MIRPPAARASGASPNADSRTWCSAGLRFACTALGALRASEGARGLLSFPVLIPGTVPSSPSHSPTLTQVPTPAGAHALVRAQAWLVGQGRRPLRARGLAGHLFPFPDDLRTPQWRCCRGRHGRGCAGGPHHDSACRLVCAWARASLTCVLAQPCVHARGTPAPTGI